MCAFGYYKTMTELFLETAAFAEDLGDNGDLMRKVWENTPWMIDVYTDSPNTDRWYDVMQWCQGEFGQERWPLHGIEGDWHTGGATIHGWTWIGFATEEMMNKFLEKFPPEKYETN